MEIQKKAIELINKIASTRPFEILHRIDRRNEGMLFIINYINEKSSDVSAGELASALSVSTARVAVLLKKLEKKGYAKKYTNKKDGRITMVAITDKGIDFMNSEKEKNVIILTKLIDKIGFEELDSFIKTALKIKNLKDL